MGAPKLSIDCTFKLEHDRNPFTLEHSPKCDKCGLCACADGDLLTLGHPQYCYKCCPESKRGHLVHKEPPFLSHDPFSNGICIECGHPRIEGMLTFDTPAPKFKCDDYPFFMLSFFSCKDITPISSDVKDVKENIRAQVNKMELRGIMESMFKKLYRA